MKLPNSIRKKISVIVIAFDLCHLWKRGTVWIRLGDLRATVLSQAQHPRSYVVETDEGTVLQRNHRHLVPFVNTNAQSITERVTAQGSETSAVVPSCPTAKQASEQQGADGGDPAVRMRSSHRVVPPDRLKL